jgi:O-antigen/teichoic acid export membrane protein
MSNSSTSSNFNQALWLGIGQMGTFALTFISAAILSRYLSKEEYGTYRQVLYVYTTMMSIFTIGLPTVFYYFIPRLNISQQKTLVNSLNKMFLLLGALFSIALYLLSSTIAELLKNPELAIGLKIFSPFPFFTLPTLGVEGIYTALRKTKIVTFYQIFSRVLMLLFIVLPVVLFNTNYIFAIIGWGVASFLTFVLAMHLKRSPYVKIEAEIIPNMYRTIYDYSLPLMGAFIAGFFISSADQFFISRYYGTEAFAEYSNGCLSIPIVAIIAISIKKVLLPIFSKADVDGKINDATQIYVSAVNKSINLVFPIIIYAMYFAKEIMIIIYGIDYAASGSYMKYYLIRDFLEVLPYFSVFLALGMSKVYLHMHIFGALFVWSFGFIVVKLGFDPSMIVLVRSVFYMICTVYAMIYLYKKKNINLLPRKVVKQILIVLTHSSICGYLIYIFFKPIIVSISSPILIVNITLLTYYILIIITGSLIKINYLESVFRLLKKNKK